MSVADVTLVSKGLPRACSVRRGDAFYDDRATGLSDRIAVFLDGKELPEVQSWNVDAGEIVRIIRHQDGTAIVDEQGIPACERLKGRVEVRWKTSSRPTPRAGGSAA